MSKQSATGADDNINQINQIQEAAVCAAASQGRLFLIKKYIESGFPITPKVLYRAVQNGRTAVIRELLNTTVDVNQMPNLVVACQKGYTRIVGALVDRGANVHADNEKPLLEAIRHNNTGCVNLLLSKGADVHVENDLPLIEACRKRSTSIVSALVRNGANVDARDGQPLTECATKGFHDIIEILVEGGADVNIENDAPLRHAAQGNHIYAMISLLNAGANRNVLDEYSHLDETTLTILDTFTKGSRLKRLRMAISDSLKKQDFKWQEYCSPLPTKRGDGKHTLKLLQDQAILFDIDTTGQTKREICASFAQRFEQEMNRRTLFEEGVTDLSGTPLNELPYWKIMVIENIPFNVFDLIKLVKKKILINPYTRNPLPLQRIKDAEERLRRVLTKTRYKDFNLLEQVAQLPILTDEIILRNRLQTQVFDRLLYAPPISVIMDADDDEIDEMARKLKLICKYREPFTLPSVDIYPMITNRVVRNILNQKGFAKKREFVNLLSTIVSHVDDHSETRSLTVSIVLKHFHTSSTEDDLSDALDDDLAFIMEDFEDDDDEMDYNDATEWWGFDVDDD